tara:strand:+ start:1294 stop:1500 length:207 start_codon:yes stop_codon:yes gene_type:complete
MAREKGIRIRFPDIDATKSSLNEGSSRQVPNSARTSHGFWEPMGWHIAINEGLQPVIIGTRQANQTNS